MLFFDTPALSPAPEETFIWVVTKTEMRWVSSPLGREGLTREVAGLRCGLDKAAWGRDRDLPELDGNREAAPDAAGNIEPAAFQPGPRL